MCKSPACCCESSGGSGLALAVVAVSVVIAGAGSAILAVAGALLEIVAVCVGSLALLCVAVLTAVIVARRSRRSRAGARGLNRLSVVYWPGLHSAQRDARALPAPAVLEGRLLPPGRSAERWEPQTREIVTRNGASRSGE